MDLIKRLFATPAAEVDRIDRELVEAADAIHGGTITHADLARLLEAVESGRWAPRARSGLRPSRGPRLDDERRRRARDLAARVVYKFGRPGPGGLGERAVERGDTVWISDGTNLRTERARPDFAA